jgi:cytochrome bd-type quinol oxidase subunit 2
MEKRIKNSLGKGKFNLRIFLAIAFTALIIPGPVSADSSCWGTCVGQVNGQEVATIKCLECVVARILNVVTILAGVAVLVMLIAGGFQYLTAGDNPKSAEKAGKTLTAAAIGLVVIIGAWLIIRAISWITGINITVFRVFIPS